MNNNYLTNSVANSLIPVPILLSAILVQGHQDHSVKKNHKIQVDNRAVFHQLPNQNITIEQSQMNTLITFVSKLANESKDLDGEIVDMINRNFEELLLKL